MKDDYIAKQIRMIKETHTANPLALSRLSIAYLEGSKKEWEKERIEREKREKIIAKRVGNKCK